MNRDTLGQLERSAGQTGDYSQLIAYIEPLAQGGSAEAQCCFAALHHLGKGVPPNGAAAAEWYQRSAAQGYALASHSLSSLYITGGENLERSEALAAYWNTRAKEQGFPS